MTEEQPVKRKRGRPKGSKNKSKQTHVFVKNDKPSTDTLAVGQKVCLTYDPDRMGKLVRVGPEQSEIAFSRKETRIYVNKDIKVVT